MEKLKLKVVGGETDGELRQLAKQHPFNGEYTTEICRRCGLFRANLDGHWETAKIVDVCGQCVNTPNE